MHVSSRRRCEADGKEMKILWSSQRVGLEAATWAVVGCGVRKLWTARSAPQRHHKRGLRVRVPASHRWAGPAG